jgi:hypothetical protein
LFKQLPSLYALTSQADQLVVPVTPDRYVWTALKQYNEDLGYRFPEGSGSRSPLPYKNAWLFSLVIQIAVALAQSPRKWSTRNSHAIRALGEFLDRNFGIGPITFPRVAAELSMGLAKFDFSAFSLGSTLLWEAGEKRAGLPVSAVQDRLLQLVRFCLEEVGAVLLLDHLDEAWDTSVEAHDLMVGLLMAAKQLNTEMRASNGQKGLRIIVFLRSDIYRRLRFDDKDKHRPLEQPLTWTPDELAAMVSARLQGNRLLDELFLPDDVASGYHPFAYIVKRTFLRPRDVLQFLDACFRVAPADATRLTRSDIARAEEQYSRWKVEDLQQEFSGPVPYFAELLECLRQGPDRYRSLLDLTRVINEQKTRLAGAHGTRSLLEALFDASVIGVRIGRNQEVRFKCEDDDLILPPEAPVFIHAGLISGLNLVPVEGQ